MDSVPREILELIFSYTSHPQVLRLICRRWNKLILQSPVDLVVRAKRKGAWGRHKIMNILHLYENIRSWKWKGHIRHLYLISNLTTLRSLDLGNNTDPSLSSLLYGLDVLSHLTSLTSSVLPLEILPYLTQLQSLSWHGYSHLTNAVLKHCTNLTHLDAHIPHYQDITDISRMTKLQSLTTSSNRSFFGGRSPPSLTSITFTSKRAYGIWKQLNHLPSIKWVTINGLCVGHPECLSISSIQVPPTVERLTLSLINSDLRFLNPSPYIEIQRSVNGIDADSRNTVYAEEGVQISVCANVHLTRIFR